MLPTPVMRWFQILIIFLGLTLPLFSQETPAAKLITALEKLNSSGPIEVRATISFKKSIRVQGIIMGEDFDIVWKAEDGSAIRQIALGENAWATYDGKKWKTVDRDDRLVFNIVRGPIRVTNSDAESVYEEVGTEQHNGETWLHIRYKPPQEGTSVPEYWLELDAGGQPISVRRYVGAVAFGNVNMVQCEADYAPAEPGTTIKPPPKKVLRTN
jgi:hypothetical protein